MRLAILPDVLAVRVDDRGRVVQNAGLRPDDFDLAQYWTASVAGFEAQKPPVDVIVRVAERGHHELRWLTQNSACRIIDETPVDSGWTECRIAFESVDDAYFDLLRLGSDAEITAPASLRARMIETVGAMSARYGAEDPRQLP
ncbi:MAG: helix-turn-helix transcriptional regulator [Actinomycetota bacterium]